MADPAAVHLFEQLFSARSGREPEDWELVVGLAVVRGEMAVQRPPADPGLATINEVASQVKLALRIL